MTPEASRFTQREPAAGRRRLIALGSGAFVVVGTAAAVSGPGASVLDAQYVPDMPFYEIIVNTMVAINTGLRVGAPVVVGFAVAAWFYYGVLGRISDRHALLNSVARHEYAGLSAVTATPGPSRRPLAKIRRTAARLVRGRAVATLLVVIAASTSSIETQITEGPVSGPVRNAFNLLDPSQSATRLVLLQSAANTFMDDSVIPREPLDALAKRVRTGSIVPFGKTLFNIDGKSSLQVSVPDALYQKLSGEPVRNRCKPVRPSVLADRTVATDHPVINGVVTRNVGTLDSLLGTNVAQMNRSVAILPETHLTKCIEHSATSRYFGALLTGFKPSEARQLVAASAVGTNAAVVSEAQFEENNRSFWRFNATPVLLQLIAYSVILGAVAVAGARRSTLEKNVREVGRIYAAGIQMKEIASVERRRALRDSAIATALALPLLPIASALINAAERGLYTGVGLREIMVGSAVVLLATLAGGQRAVKSFESGLDVSQAVKA